MQNALLTSLLKFTNTIEILPTTPFYPFFKICI